MDVFIIEIEIECKQMCFKLWFGAFSIIYGVYLPSQPQSEAVGVWNDSKPVIV